MYLRDNMVKLHMAKISVGCNASALQYFNYFDANAEALGYGFEPKNVGVLAMPKFLILKAQTHTTIVFFSGMQMLIGPFLSFPLRVVYRFFFNYPFCKWYEL